MSLRRMVMCSLALAFAVDDNSSARRWKHGRSNEFRAKIVGTPPAITAWINGKKFMEWTDKEKRHLDRGGIALPVHGGGDFTIAINDDDDGNGRDSQVVWQGTADNDKVPQFGTVILEANETDK